MSVSQSGEEVLAPVPSFKTCQSCHNFLVSFVEFVELLFGIVPRRTPTWLGRAAGAAACLLVILRQPGVGLQQAWGRLDLPLLLLLGAGCLLGEKELVFPLLDREQGPLDLMKTPLTK